MAWGENWGVKKGITGAAGQGPQSDCGMAGGIVHQLLL